MKYVLGVVGVVLLALIGLILILNRGDGRPRQQGQKELIVSEQTNANTSVRMIQQGELVGEDERREIRITVTESERRLEVRSGYREAVVRSQSYSNTPEAYATFLAALDEAGFSRGKQSEVADLRAACPLGNRFIYQLLVSG